MLNKTNLKNLLRNTFSKLYSPKYIFSSDYTINYGRRWHRVYTETEITRSAPRYFGRIQIDLTKKLDRAFPDMGVLELDSALVLCKSGWVFDENRNFLPDFSWFGKHIEEIADVPWILPRGKRLSGTAVSLASDFAVGSYGHFFYDVVSRLHLFYEAGFTLDDVDHILCPKPTTGHAEFLFNQLGLPKEKLVWIDDERSIRTQKLLAISFPGTRRNYPTWVSKFIQQSFLKDSKRPQKRRLFITRKGYRRNPSNLDEVEDVLTRYGFEVYDPVQSLNAHLDFHEAYAVVGGSGSNLTGLVFCQPNTKVLELISADHVYPYYYSMCDSAGLEFSCLTCKSVDFRGNDAWGPSQSDYYVDLGELEHALMVVLGETPGN
ncbi:MAG: glycosyltransferase family 61 protein [Flavobacteriales bacterium]|nr:glycosyltransferase family 61 protein [Flavobacteriales bacterium]